MTAPPVDRSPTPPAGREVTLLARVVPPSVVPSWRFTHVVRRELLAARAWWLTLVSGFFEPVFYLFSLGVGLGALVGPVAWRGVEVPFVAFVTPGLLAASAMNGAVFESTMNVFHKIREARTFDAMLTTPMQPGDVALGTIAYAQLRGTAYSAAFLLIAALGGYLESWWAVLALPACVLVGLAFSSIGLAVTTYLRSWQDFDLLYAGVLPLFLLSTTFFPLEVYPEALRPLVLVSPLYHGVELVRGAALGVLPPQWWLNVAVLVALAVAGLVVAGRRIDRLLLR